MSLCMRQQGIGTTALKLERLGNPHVRNSTNAMTHSLFQAGTRQLSLASY